MNCLTSPSISKKLPHKIEKSLPSIKKFVFDDPGMGTEHNNCSINNAKERKEKRKVKVCESELEILGLPCLSAI
jgi:hypothetical protein